MSRMTPRTRKYFRRRIQRKYFALTAITTYMGAMQLEMIRQQPLPKYPLGAPATGGIAMVGEHGVELVMPTKENTAIYRINKHLDIQQTVINTAFAISDILKDMKRKTDRV